MEQAGRGRGSALAAGAAASLDARSRGGARCHAIQHGTLNGRFNAVLFDWRGTLFHDERDDAWIRASAASIGRTLSVSEAQTLARALGQVGDHPEVIAARQRSDCSAELHEAAVLLELRLAGFDDELALAVYRRDGDLTATIPYPDTAETLRMLKQHGIPIGIISDIHYDLRPHFEHYGLLELVDTFTLSFQHGCQKPAPRLFEAALAALDARPAETLMVGDRAERDGGAAQVGITTLILPGAPNFAPRGLDLVPRLVGCA